MDDSSPEGPLVSLSQTDDVVWELFDAAPDAVVVVDEGGRILLVNSQAEELFGFQRTELEGQTVEILLPESLRSLHRANRLRYRAEPRTRPMGDGLELRARRADGSQVPVEIALSPLRTRSGVLTIASVRDVTQRRVAEAQVRRVQHALDATHDGVYIFEPDDLRFVYVNQGAEDQSGYTRSELVSMTPLHLAPEYTEESLRQLLDEVSRTPGRLREVTTLLRRRDGTDVSVESILQWVDDPTTNGCFVAAVRDITERTEADARLQATQRDLLLLEDRERIAMDLHDHVIQQLFGTGMGLEGLRGRLAEPLLQERLDRAISELDTVIRDIRTVIFELGTDRHAPTSMRKAILALTGDATRSLGFTPRVRFDGPLDTMVAGATREHLLAVLRESLANVARHAAASHVWVEVAVHGHLSLEVIDDGVGLAPSTTRAGNGLNNMVERAAMLGGTCTMVPRPEGGTHLRWTVPGPG